MTNRPIEAPVPCNGPLYSKWKPQHYLAKVIEEAGEVGKAYLDFEMCGGKPEKVNAHWIRLMCECADLHNAITSFQESLNCDAADRQYFTHMINESNRHRDGGRRIAKKE